METEMTDHRQYTHMPAKIAPCGLKAQVPHGDTWVTRLINPWPELEGKLPSPKIVLVYDQPSDVGHPGTWYQKKS